MSLKLRINFVNTLPEHCLRSWRRVPLLTSVRQNSGCTSTTSSRETPSACLSVERGESEPDKHYRSDGHVAHVAGSVKNFRVVIFGIYTLFDL